MAYRFGTRSRDCLDTVDPRLVRVAEAALEVVDIAILTGLRSEVAQTRAFENGTSQVPWPDGKHNVRFEPGLARAFDFSPHPFDWEDHERFRAIAFFMRGIGKAQGTDLRLGADWDGDFSSRDQRFHDLGHVELA